MTTIHPVSPDRPTGGEVDKLSEARDMTTSKSKQLNVRIPPLTQDQLRELGERTGLTLTQIVIMALDRLAHAELPSSILTKPHKG